MLKEWSVVGKLKPNQKLKDKDLFEMLGISRTPAREALIRLENIGLVETKANRWTQVAPIEVDKARNYYSIVWALEILTLKQGFSQINDEVIGKLMNHFLK